MKENELGFLFHSKEVRLFVIENSPWFVAKDVCDAIGLSNTTEAIRGIDGDDKSTLRISEGGPAVNIINESGLYSLVLRSNKPEAKQFKKWVTSEILPSIRKHGAYMTPDTLEKALTSPDFLIQLATKLKDEQTARIEAENKLQIAQPKAESWEMVAEDEGFLVTAGEMAKLLAMPGLNESKVRGILRQHNILCTTKNELTADAIRKGFGRVVIDEFDTGYRVIPTKTPKFRGKAIDLVARCWKQNGLF